MGLRTLCPKRLLGPELERGGAPIASCASHFSHLHHHYHVVDYYWCPPLLLEYLPQYLSPQRRTMASLEEELGYPVDASLVIPTTLPGPIRLSFTPPHSLPSLTLSNPSQRSSDVSVSISTVVSPASSSRNYDDPNHWKIIFKMYPISDHFWIYNLGNSHASNRYI